MRWGLAGVVIILILCFLIERWTEYSKGSGWFLRNGRRFESRWQMWGTLFVEIYVVWLTGVLGVVFAGMGLAFTMKRRWLHITVGD